VLGRAFRHDLAHDMLQHNLWQHLAARFGHVDSLLVSQQGGLLMCGLMVGVGLTVVAAVAASAAIDLSKLHPFDSSKH